MESVFLNGREEVGSRNEPRSVSLLRTTEDHSERNLDKNSELKELLTSYFMKTAVFWEIQNDSSNWTIQNFLTKFWGIYRRIIKWVHIGYIPNFFMPQNNMLFGRLHGKQQGRLKSELCAIYKHGVGSLLKCPSLAKKLTTILSQPETIQNLSLEEDKYVNKYQIVKQGLGCVFVFDDALPKDSVSAFKAVFRTLCESSESPRMQTALNLRARALVTTNVRINLISTA
ncbi:hypothetical protein FSP39_021167 [Pinctada imbricata]|uniref:Mab-21-like HhH/H2TH-like domain-containing protein n=1 Tax=Pinctada imbricata TaxID=66713 RepID=A0AA89BMD0_PINIB|nr:hypothetical protein FSP39_021167 [Pinctada imbricata]